jgi:hypothetical protein
MHSFVRSLIEKKKMQGKDPCWDGYQMVGLKKNGDPNCVPTKEEVEMEEGFENLPGKATHLTNKDIRHPEHGIIAGSTTLRHVGGDKYEVRAGRAKGKTVDLDKDHVQKMSEEVNQIDEISSELAGKVSDARFKRVMSMDRNDPKKPEASAKFSRSSESARKRITRDMIKDPEKANRGFASDADKNTKRGWSNEEVERIDEISADTARSYLDKSKTAKTDLAKVAKRFAGSLRAHGVIHRDELKKIGDRAAQQRKDLGLQREETDICHVCGQTPCNCTHISEADMHKSSVAKSSARIENKHRESSSMAASTNPASNAVASKHQRMAASKKAINKLQESSMKTLSTILAEADQNTVHPNGIHVKPVSVDGQQKYKVHAVGKNFQHGIKAGEHLSDSELDDFSEMGGKIKHVK